MIGISKDRPARAILAIAPLALVFFAGCQKPAATATTAPTMFWDPHANSVTVREIPKRLGDRLAKEESRGGDFLIVRTDVADSAPMLGRILVAKHISGSTALVFFARFPFVPGMNYRAVFDTAKFPDVEPVHVESQFTAPKSAAAASAGVTQVYPTANRLPENLLRFYVHFSTPMRRGEAYSHILLLDEKGTVIASPFLEIAEELWDPDGQRLTLFIDPGRIKRGLKPREDLGPVLEAEKNYTLVIRGDWKDADGQGLGQDHKKMFRAEAAMEKGIDPSDWKFQPPAAGTKSPLVVRFPRPLDHALLGRALSVVGADGRPISGTIAVSASETNWQLTPQAAWSPGRYELVIHRVLEDVCGNRVGRAFEVDEDTRPVNAEGPPVRRTFEIR
jgi:hypothetical protein